jgi:WbqC-like protein family
VQSSYIPWKGYFDLINMVDEFVLYDDRQFTRRDWRNRNRIKTPQGTRWLTIPVRVKGKYLQRIDETVVDGHEWRERHWKTLVHSYSSAPFFDEYAEKLRPLYVESDDERLSAVNRRFLERACEILGIRTPLRWSTEYEPEGAKSERLLSICLQAGATSYLSGPSAQAYLDEDLFRANGIEVDYMSYDDYPEYPQLHPPFEHSVSIVDLIFTTGLEAPSYMKSFA